MVVNVFIRAGGSHTTKYTPVCSVSSDSCKNSGQYRNAVASGSVHNYMLNADPTLPRFGTDPNLSLTVWIFEDGVADFDAVGDREHVRHLAFAPVFQQHNPVRRECLLYDSIIEEFAGVFHGYSARRTFLIFEPEHAQRAGADVKTCLSLLFIDQIDDVKLKSFLLLFALKRNRGTAFFVTQQRIETVLMLR